MLGEHGISTWPKRGLLLVLVEGVVLVMRVVAHLWMLVLKMVSILMLD